MKRIKRVRAFLDPIPTDGTPWVCDWRSYDIPATVCAGIRNAAPGLVAVTLRWLPIASYVRAVERAARKRGVRILWCGKGTPIDAQASG